MPASASPRSGRSFSLVVLASVLIVFVVTSAMLGGFVLWSGAKIDENAIDRQSQRVVHALSEQLSAIPHEQESVTVWDDAVNAATNGDLHWLDGNIGEWMFSYFGHDESYVLSADDNVIYASREGVRTASPSFRDRAPALLPMIGDLRAMASIGYADKPPHLTDYMLIDGQPTIVSVMPIVSDTGNIQQQPGREPMLVSVTRLDISFEMALVNKYMMEVGRFTTTASTPGFISVPVTNRAGRIVAFFEWEPYRPGRELLERTAPALAIAFVIMGGVLLVLLYRLWVSSSALESKQRDAERQATRDALTGLPNRLGFDREFERLLRARRPRDPALALLMLDLDRFKQVNDTLGHHAGDDLIQAVGQRLQALIRSSDVLARLGGDEFAILCSCTDGQDGISALAQRIIEAIGKPFRIQSSEAFVGVSIGVVIAGPIERDSRELARKADIALYEAKSGGRNRAAVYAESMNDLVQGRHLIEAELREALRRGDQLWVAYQPLYSRAPAEIVGFEALVRWNHPRLGEVSPAHFVAIAEGSGLIEPLGEFVLTEACALGAQWPGRTVAVNISPAQLRNPNFADRVFALLRRSGMRPADLEIEITEGILLDDESNALAAIRAFREAGIRIVLDDFGTGYSSLNYLKRYPVDRIKIDRSFVNQIATTDASDAIVQAMVTLAHALGIQVTAEGVETEQQHHMLEAMGCNTFQGFLLSSPLTIDALTHMLERPEPFSAARVA